MRLIPQLVTVPTPLALSVQWKRIFRTLRSPDNLEWADNGMIFVQEDRAETDTLTGEVLFGDGAVNPNEAGITLNPRTGSNVNRNLPDMWDCTSPPK